MESPDPSASAPAVERRETFPGEPGTEPELRPPIELGWLIVGRLDTPDREAVDRARERVLATLSGTFPGFRWLMPVVEREAPVVRTREAPVELIDQGAIERQAKGWDFAVVVTGAELQAFEKPFALGAPARSLAVAAASTIRIDPRASGRGGAGGDRVEVMARRLHALVLHLFGHLNGLEHAEDAHDLMFDVQAVEDLDRMAGLSEAGVKRLVQELDEVADLRLEERTREEPRNRWAFYARAAWHNLDDIAGSIRQARPWEFPLRLSRLTTAAFSALLVLVITAEAWDLGMTQGRGFVAGLSVVTLVVTSGYILRRQRLLVRRQAARLSELTVVSDVSIVLAVFLGMATTYAVLFSVTLLLAYALFSPRLVAGWAATLDGGIETAHYLVFAGFVASLGILIGALGASFEEQSYFRHVAYVDEET